MHTQNNNSFFYATTRANEFSWYRTCYGWNIHTGSVCLMRSISIEHWADTNWYRRTGQWFYSRTALATTTTTTTGGWWYIGDYRCRISLRPVVGLTVIAAAARVQPAVVIVVVIIGMGKEGAKKARSSVTHRQQVSTAPLTRLLAWVTMTTRYRNRKTDDWYPIDSERRMDGTSKGVQIGRRMKEKTVGNFVNFQQEILRTYLASLKKRKFII